MIDEFKLIEYLIKVGVRDGLTLKDFEEIFELETVDNSININAVKTIKTKNIIGKDVIEKYDKNGNLVYYECDDNYTWYEYDQNNRLMHYKDSVLGEYWNIRDSSGKLICTKWTDGEENYYDDDGCHIVYSKYPDGRIEYKYF